MSNVDYEAKPSARKPRRDRTPDHMFSGRFCERCGKELVHRCCRTHEAEDLKGDIFGRHFIVCPTCQSKRCEHAENCANACTGQQPAQPESGEVSGRPISFTYNDGSGPGKEGWWSCVRELDPSDSPVVPMAAYDRLQSALTEAQEIIDTRTHNATVLSESYMACKDGYDHISKCLTAAQQEIALHKADAANAIARTDEIGRRLTEAQQREADLREALRKYGWHKPECDYMQEELPCTCGFLTAVERGFPENSND